MPIAIKVRNVHTTDVEQSSGNAQHTLSKYLVQVLGIVNEPKIYNFFSLRRKRQGFAPPANCSTS